MRYLVRALVALVIGVSLGLGLLALMEGGNPLTVLAVLAVVTVGFWVNVLFHETGHALAGWAVGWQIKVFVVAPIGFQIAHREIALITGAKRGKRGGWVLAVPPTPQLATRWRLAVFILGGPVASLIVTMASVAMVIGYTLADDNIGAPVLLFSSFGLQSFAIFIGTIIPHKDKDKDKGKGDASDGAKIVSIILNRRAGPEEHVMGWIVALRRASVRLRDLPHWMIDLVRSRAGDVPEVLHWVDGLRVGGALDADQPDVAQCRSLLDDYSARHGNNHWSVACDAYLAAVFENDVERAAAVLGTMTTPSPIPQLTLAAEAAVSMRHGNRIAASEKLDEMTRIVRQEQVFSDHTYLAIRRKIEAIGA